MKLSYIVHLAIIDALSFLYIQEKLEKETQCFCKAEETEETRHKPHKHGGNTQNQLLGPVQINLTCFGRGVSVFFN